MVKLIAETSLRGYAGQFAGVELTELGSVALVSVAPPQDGNEALANALNRAFGIDLPAVGSVRSSSDGQWHALGLQSDQLFLLFDHDGGNAVAQVATKLGNTAYFTDQSDSWAILRMAGSGCRTALRRLCMLDLDSRQFRKGSVARTTMAHLAVILLREDEDSWLLLSPRSSAQSFVASLEGAVSSAGS